MLVLGIEDPQIWLAYIASILSAVGCMVYGAIHWKSKEDQPVKNSVKKPEVQDQ
ncbi:hypothetical protein RSJ42_02395 [Methanosarcina hadiensis]|uniref:symporter small accessory protein n=1 Tax=Methanosarcina hadiensis TaxID=3078083 RepID=UPI003977E11B